MCEITASPSRARHCEGVVTLRTFISILLGRTGVAQQDVPVKWCQSLGRLWKCVCCDFKWLCPPICGGGSAVRGRGLPISGVVQDEFFWEALPYLRNSERGFSKNMNGHPNERDIKRT